MLLMGLDQGEYCVHTLLYIYMIYLEPSNIKAGYYIGEILLTQLTFVDDICVFCPSVRGLQRILDVCQAGAGLHEIIFNAAKLFVWCLRLRVQKHSHPVAGTGCTEVKSVSCYKYLGIVLDIELSDDKDIQRQMRYQYEAVNKLQASFFRHSNAVKSALIRSFCRSMFVS